MSLRHRRHHAAALCGRTDDALVLFDAAFGSEGSFPSTVHPQLIDVWRVMHARLLIDRDREEELLLEFLADRMGNVDGFVVFHAPTRYQIELPAGWVQGKSAEDGEPD